jgi:uncharacterized protein (DUF1697 family)
MRYVALLRGINVGGNNRVDMKLLRQTFENTGLRNVTSYINSGNIIFEYDVISVPDMVSSLEAAIEKDFGFPVKVLIRSADNIKMVAGSLPGSWTNDASMKCDVMFLWENYDNKSVIGGFKINPHKEDVKYVPGAILWRVDRDYITRSAMLRLAGTELYKHMTIRNCNTVRELADRTTL